MAWIRQPAVAGTFYPGVPRELEMAVTNLLDEAGKRPALADRASAPKAMVVPHAGYIYSGAVAASAYASLAPIRTSVRRVVLLGPTHRVAVRGLATTSAESFLTPLGEVPIDRAAVERALALPQVQVVDAAHTQEHSLEVHLPFLQCSLDRFSLVPFAVGDASPAEVSEVLDLLWGEDETLIVISSDLSHYHDYETARELDAATTRAIESLDPDGLDSESACGRVPVRGLLVSAKQRKLSVETVDLRNSGDTAGSRDRVVGYGSYLFTSFKDNTARAEQSTTETWEPGFDETLLSIAARSIEVGADTNAACPVDPSEHPAPLRAIRSSFVTLNLAGELRGCVGSLEARMPLVSDVAQSAFLAAYRDPRFKPVTAEERQQLEIHVSVLGPAEPMHFVTEEDLLRQLQPGRDGLILRDGKSRATFLPDVWKSLPEPTEFLRRLKVKAGLSEDHWSPNLEILRYETRSIGHR